MRLDEDTTYTFTAADFGLSSANTTHSVERNLQATAGTMLWGGDDISTLGQKPNVTVSFLNAGTLAYRPDADANGENYASFSFQVSDGFTTGSDVYTMTIHVNPINDDPTGTPVIIGTTVVGHTLAADTNGISDPDGTETLFFAYQWIRVDGETDTNIGTDSPTYELVEDDIGKALKVEVSFTDDDGITEDLTSAETGTVGPAEVSSNIAPVLQNAVITGRATVVLTYDEALDPDSVPDGGAYDLSISYQSAAGSPVENVSVSGRSVTLTMSASSLTGLVPGLFDDRYQFELTYTPPSTNPLQDAAGNDVAVFTNRRLIKQPPDNIHPTVTITSDATHPTKDPFTVTLTFSEGVIGLMEDEITVSGASKGAFTANSATVYTLQVMPDTDYEGDVTITVPAGAAQDRAENDNVAAAATLEVDTRSPTVGSAASNVDGNQITVQFSETLSAATGTANAWRVTVNSNEHTPSSAMVSGDTVTLELFLVDRLLSGQMVSVSYTDPSPDDDANAVQDVAGNDAASFIKDTANQSQSCVISGALQRAVNEQLGRAENEVTTADMKSLTSLSARNQGITDLSCLEFATNLTDLDLWGNKLEADDIPEMAGLTGLTWLNLGAQYRSTNNGQVPSLTSTIDLSALTNLTYLNLSSNRLTSLNVSALTQLEQLSMSFNRLGEQWESPGFE